MIKFSCIRLLTCFKLSEKCKKRNFWDAEYSLFHVRPNRLEKRGFEMLVLVYRKCSTCLKALKWLDANGVEYVERAIVEENPTYEELKEWYGKSGLPLKKFFNTSGVLYKEMQLKDKLPAMSEEEQLKLLATDGKLVKRPLVVGDDFVLTGFKEVEWNEKML